MMLTNFWGFEFFVSSEKWRKLQERNTQVGMGIRAKEKRWHGAIAIIVSPLSKLFQLILLKKTVLSLNQN